MTATIERRTAAVVPVVMLSAVAALAEDKATPPPALEEVYVLRSIREQQQTSKDWCSSDRIGFAPIEKESERFFSFWSVRSQAVDGNAVMISFPEAGLYPVHCHLKLSGMPMPYVGGLLTTNTMTSNARLGGETDPAGYTQASIATIRLWKAK